MGYVPQSYVPRGEIQSSFGPKVNAGANKVVNVAQKGWSVYNRIKGIWATGQAILTNPIVKWGTTALLSGTKLTGAGIGATEGSAFGPLGTLVGGIGGLLTAP